MPAAVMDALQLMLLILISVGEGRVDLQPSNVVSVVTSDPPVITRLQQKGILSVSCRCNSCGLQDIHSASPCGMTNWGTCMLT